MAMRPRAFSGVQPTGELHLGNYLGAVRPWVERQGDVEGYFAVVDLHAMTSLPDPAELRASTRRTAALLVACGVDAATVFVQSHVAEHAELAWLLGCLCPSGWLLRMIQFRERAAGAAGEGPGAGLLMYPVLMAADILLYDAEVVPVGEDQRQHLELCRTLVRRVNARYGPVLREPSAASPSAGARVMGLDDPTQKMSKSSRAPHHRIGLLDSPAVVRRTVARATTDSFGEVTLDPEARPGVSNLVAIDAALGGEAPEQVVSRFAGRGYGALKGEVAERVVATLEPIQRRYRELEADPHALDAALARAAERSRGAASETMRRVRAAMGLALAEPAPGARGAA